MQGFRRRRGFVAALLACSPAILFGQRSGAEAAPLTVAQRKAVLQDPTRAFWKAKAPAAVEVDVETSRGTFTIALMREWAPLGADRFYNLARAGYYDDSRFFRVIPWFVAQFGIAGNPVVGRIWSRRLLKMDSVRAPNTRGTVSFAQYTPRDRTTNVFVNLRDNTALDSLGFAPIGRVVAGMDVVDSLYAGYGEIPAAAAPLGNPKRLHAESNRYLDVEFPKLDRLVAMTVRIPSAPAETTSTRALVRAAVRSAGSHGGGRPRARASALSRP